MNMQIAVRRALPRPLLLSHRNRLSLQTGNKMAAAGPSTRASSAAAAAALSRRGRRGRCDEMAAAKAGAPGPASSPALLVLRSAPRPEESGCTGCLETPGEVAALPCSHSRCRGCASRAAGPGCRRCRPRGSGWARRRARDDSQAAAELMGERARRGQPEPCRPRRDGGAAASGPRPEPEPLAEPGGASPRPCGLQPGPAAGSGLVSGVEGPGLCCRGCGEFCWGRDRVLPRRSMCW